MSKEKAISEVSVKTEQFIRQKKKKTAGFPIFKIFFIKGLILIGFRMEIWFSIWVIYVFSQPMKIANQAKHLASGTVDQNSLLEFLLKCYTLNDKEKFWREDEAET